MIKEKIKEFDIQVVNEYNNFSNIDSLISFTKKLKDYEGFVITFEDGHKVKIKADEYCEIHSMLDDIRYDKSLVGYILKETIDDIVGKVDANTAVYIKKFELDFHNCLKDLIEKYDRYFSTVLSSGLDRKKFAIEWLPTIKADDPFAGQYVFGRFDNKDGRDMILKYIQNSLGTNPKWEECARWMGMSVGRKTATGE